MAKIRHATILYPETHNEKKILKKLKLQKKITEIIISMQLIVNDVNLSFISVEYIQHT